MIEVFCSGGLNDLITGFMRHNLMNWVSVFLLLIFILLLLSCVGLLDCFFVGLCHNFFLRIKLVNENLKVSKSVTNFIS